MSKNKRRIQTLMEELEQDVQFLPRRLEELQTRRLARLEGTPGKDTEAPVLTELVEVGKILFERFYEYKRDHYEQSPPLRKK